MNWIDINNSQPKARHDYNAPEAKAFLVTDGKQQAVAYWCEDLKKFAASVGIYSSVTHWMPLPDMPSKKQKTEQEIKTVGFIRTKDAAKLLGVSQPTLWRLHKTDPTFPKKIKFSSRCVRWRAESLINWMANKEADLL